MNGDQMSESSAPPDFSSPSAMLIQRLHSAGVPMSYLDTMEMGLLQFVRENKDLLKDMVSVLIPGAEDMQIQDGVKEERAVYDYMQRCREGIRWAQWLMFEGDPEEVMKGIGHENGHIRSVCGTVWGPNDVAYRCRTCQNDPTCAICVSCFEPDKHINHDYSMIHTGGGCCDCGDVTAWKESGCCSRHNGTGTASLPDGLMLTFEPVMEALLHKWGCRLRSAASLSVELPTKVKDHVVQKVATQTSLAFIEMLLNFCHCSESLLTCSGNLIVSNNIGLLDLLLKSEHFLPEEALGNLHELLLKLIGNPSFKYHFAKTFICYYPQFIQEGLRESLESLQENRSRKNATLSSLSVQIFTVPALTSLLVVEQNLLDMLFEVLKDAFLLCSGGNAQQLVNKRRTTLAIFLHIISDIHFVLRHADVAHYVARERPDLLHAWLHLVAFTQGMDPQQRRTTNHVEEEIKNWFTAYKLETQMADIHPFIIEGTAKMDSFDPPNGSLSHGWMCDESAVHGHAKIGRLSVESDVSGKVGTTDSLAPMDVDSGSAACASTQGNNFLDDVSFDNSASRAAVVPAVLLWLIAECSKVLDIWLFSDEYRELVKLGKSNNQKGRPIQRQGLHLRGKRGRATARSCSWSSVENIEGEILDTNGPQGHTFKEWLRTHRDIEPLRRHSGLRMVSSSQQGHTMLIPEVKDNQNESTEWWMGTVSPNLGVSPESLQSERDWLEVDFDVSKQEVSFHIPLHRFLALALQTSLKVNPNLNYKEGNKRSWLSQDYCVSEKGNLLHLFPSCYQAPSFISCLMEHPLRIQVLCAQVRAGMWRRNGQSVQALCECYHSVRWCEGSLDLDLFLLQCCGVLAPTEEFMERILCRFGLEDFFSMYLQLPNEYETAVAQHLLALLIRIVAERGLCGLGATECCRRELIKRLAAGDATHSQLMESLPPHLHEDEQWEETLSAVATYYKPSGMQQGKFSLREECWKELDLYHPRWNARELQLAEDRYSRACKVSPVVKQTPQWHKPFSPLENLSKLVTCKKVHDILRSVLFHAVFSKKLSESRAPENVLITALHLLALGLDVCSRFSHRGVSDHKGGSFSNETDNCDLQEPHPLLESATERVDCFTISGYPEIRNRESLISLLVLLMQRYQGDREAHMTAGESALDSIGALAKILLENFSDLHSGCKHEIESLAPEVWRNRASPAHDDQTVMVKQAGLSEADRRKLLARERQAAVMAKMKAAQEKFVASCQSLPEQGDSNTDESSSKGLGVSFSSQREQYTQTPSVVMCALCRDSSSSSRLSFLTFVQRSKLLEIAAEVVPSWDRRDISSRIEASTYNEESLSTVDSEVQESQIRVELLNLIQIALNGEANRERSIEVEALLAFLGGGDFTESFEGSQSVADGRMVETSSDSESNDSEVEECVIGSSDSPYSLLHCSQVCSAKGGSAAEYEDEKAKIRQNFLITTLLEYANILSKSRKDQQQLDSEHVASSPKNSVSRLMRRNAIDGLSGPVGSLDLVGTHMSSCGHAVHHECLDRYLTSLLRRHQSRTLFEGLQIVDPNQREFLCPVCRRLANSALPCLMEGMVPGVVKEDHSPNFSLSPDASSTASLSLVSLAMNLLQNGEELCWKSGFRKAVSKPLPKKVRSTFDSLFWTLFNLHYPKRESNGRLSSKHRSQTLLLWDALRYTIASEELASRTPKGAHIMESEHTLKALFKAAEQGSMLPVLLRAAKAVQNQNRLSLLLRARGMQLLVGSICFGISQDLLAQPLMPGSVSKLLLLIDNGKEAADIHFWRRTADPVLVHDPFSSLFWIVFCLPLSFPDSASHFVALVHLLYLVCVLQIMACLGNNVLSNLSELLLSPSAHTCIQTMLADLSGVGVFQPLSNQALENLPGSLLLTVRIFTLPYLRRCALLGKLLCDDKWEEIGVEIGKSHDFTMDEGVDWSNHDKNLLSSASFKDLKELEYLEQKFSLPSLQTILENVSHREIAMRWCNHLCKEAGLSKLLPAPRPTLAAPFKLMDLPSLYQTLLQTYIRERCPVCSSVPNQPALCLLCGTLCSGIPRDACCRQSECFRHAMACNGGVGVFLMLKETNILLQRSAWQAFWPSPYLDAFGEEDIDMLRGKPLHLNEDRYSALTKMVVSHGLDHRSLLLSHTNWETLRGD